MRENEDESPKSDSVPDDEDQRQTDETCAQARSSGSAADFHIPSGFAQSLLPNMDTALRLPALAVVFVGNPARSCVHPLQTGEYQPPRNINVTCSSRSGTDTMASPMTIAGTISTANLCVWMPERSDIRQIRSDATTAKPRSSGASSG